MHWFLIYFKKCVKVMIVAHGMLITYVELSGMIPYQGYGCKSRRWNTYEPWDKNV